MAVEFQNRVLALAGLVQAIHLVVGAARTGMVSQDSLEKTLKCIFVQNPGSISEVYSGSSDIRLGIGLLGDMLQRFDGNDHGEILKYSLSALSLASSALRRDDLMSTLGRRINQIPHDPIDDDTVVALAEAYESTLSQIEPRIRISGNRNHLQNLTNVQRIRALLLSAVRSAVLFEQLGGRRWQLIFYRGKYRSALEHLT